MKQEFIKTKELVDIEFRYYGKPKGDYDSEFKSKTITMGVFDTFEEAVIVGNKLLELLENKFKLHVFPKGDLAPKERFSKTGGCFGYPKRLITNLAYLQTPFEFYARIKSLEYSDAEQTILGVLESINTYKEYKRDEQDEQD